MILQPNYYSKCITVSDDYSRRGVEIKVVLINKGLCYKYKL